MLSNVLLGQAVHHLSDNHELGVIREIRGDHFRVVTAEGQDYWFDEDSISYQFGGVHLAFALPELGHYIRDEPPAT